MTDTELEALRDDLESDRVKRKESVADGDKVRQAIFAFANDLSDHSQPGVLFVGADDGPDAPDIGIHAFGREHPTTARHDGSEKMPARPRLRRRRCSNGPCSTGSLQRKVLDPLRSAKGHRHSKGRAPPLGTAALSRCTGRPAAGSRSYSRRLGYVDLPRRLSTYRRQFRYPRGQQPPATRTTNVCE